VEKQVLSFSEQETESTGDAIRQLLRENPAAQNAFMDLLKELKK